MPKKRKFTNSKAPQWADDVLMHTHQSVRDYVNPANAAPTAPTVADGIYLTMTARFTRAKATEALVSLFGASVPEGVTDPLKFADAKLLKVAKVFKDKRSKISRYTVGSRVAWFGASLWSEELPRLVDGA